MPFFQTGDVKAAVLHMRRPQQWYSDLGVSQSRVWKPGTTCITIAANIADTAVLDSRGCFPDSVLGFTPSEQTEDSYFVKYLLDVHRERLGSAARGTTQDNLSLEKLLSFRFPVPDANDRRAIVRVLRSLDDLIENIQRRVEVLEEIARAIYREWFVKFRYPGHSDVPLGDSALGPIPEGWEVGRVDSLIFLQRGFDLPLKDREPGSIPVIGASGIQGSHVAVKATGPGVATGRSGTIGVVNYVPGDYWPLNTSLWVREFRLATPRYAYFLLMELDLQHAASGAAVPTLDRKVVHGLPVVCPPASLIERWDTRVVPMFEAVEALCAQSARVTAIRDLLLPKLVTGQIDVSTLDLDGLIAEQVA